MPVVSTTVETEVVLAPAVKKRLLTELKAYEMITDQIKTLEHAKDKHKANIGAIRAETDRESISVNGYKITLVANARKKFNEKKFITLGGDLALYNMAHDNVLSKPFEKITCPGVDDGE